MIRTRLTLMTMAVPAPEKAGLGQFSGSGASTVHGGERGRSATHRGHWRPPRARPQLGQRSGSGLGGELVGHPLEESLAKMRGPVHAPIPCHGLDIMGHLRWLLQGSSTGFRRRHRGSARRQGLCRKESFLSGPRSSDCRALGRVISDQVQAMYQRRGTRARQRLVNSAYNCPGGRHRNGQCDRSRAAGSCRRRSYPDATSGHRCLALISHTKKCIGAPNQ